MQELRTVLDAAGRLAARGEEGVLATVVRVEGSTYRRPGARLLVGRGGEWVGGVSGGGLGGGLVGKGGGRAAGGAGGIAHDSPAHDHTHWQPRAGGHGGVPLPLRPGRP